MCKHCAWCISEHEGDYGEYHYVYCEKETGFDNLKGFPFAKPPKSCLKNKRFEINQESYPAFMNGWSVYHYLCSEICKKSDQYEKDCELRSCEAFNYLYGRTDIKKPTEKLLRQELVGKKFSYRDENGRKYPFETNESKS